MEHVARTALIAAAAALLATGLLRGQAPPGSPAPRPAAALTLRDAVALALRHNPRLAGARAEERRIEGEALRPLQGILPTLQLQEQWLRSDDPSSVMAFKMKSGAFSAADLTPAGFTTPPPPFYMFGGQVALQVPLLNLDAWVGRGQARSGLRAARLGVERGEEELTFGVLRAYFAVPLAAERIAAVRDAEAVAARAVAQAEALEQQHLVAPVDVLQARSRLAATRAELAGALAFESFQSVSWWDSKIAQRGCLVQLDQLANGNPRDVREARTLVGVIKLLGLRIFQTNQGHVLTFNNCFTRRQQIQSWNWESRNDFSFPFFRTHPKGMRLRRGTFDCSRRF